MLKRRYKRSGSVLVLVVVCIVILSAIGLGLMTVSYGIRHRAAMLRSEAIATLAAEAGYEYAIYQMSQQPDMLTALDDPNFASTGEIEFENSICNYEISFDSFIGSRPVYRVRSVGRSGIFERTVDVYVIQAISGWDMGMCRVPVGATRTEPVYYVTGEIIDMPLHINSYGDPYDSSRDIHISGSPDFRRTVTMSESRYSAGGLDKYADVMGLFDAGIYFLQPSSRILDYDTVQRKVDSFRQTLQEQKPQFIFTPTKNNGVPNGMATVQLEFYVENGVGKVRITNNCTVRGSNPGSFDYRIDLDSETLRFEKYMIYGFHYIPEDAETTGDRFVCDVTDTYVVPSYGGVEGEPGGQIFVDGNVVIGGRKPEHDGGQLVKGRITVVATGNIWIADNILVDGPHDGDGLPSEDNPNVLGLVSQQVIKVVDPGELDELVGGVPPEVSGAEFEPIGLVTEIPGGGGGGRRGRWGGGGGGGSTRYDCYLPRYTTIEAAITVGGGGWGAENVGSRKENGYGQNYLVVHGTITEAVRGVVGYGSDGYNKRYYLDERLLEGILPGDIWLRGKYIPAPAGWHDYRSEL